MNELSTQEINLVAGGDSIPTVTVTGTRWNSDTKAFYDAMQQHNLSGYGDMIMLGLFGRVDFGAIFG